MIERQFIAPFDVAFRPLVTTPAAHTCDLCVVIPVRDERETLEATLTALTHQTDSAGKPLDPSGYEIVILANNCRDDSAAIAHEVVNRHPEIALHVVEITLPAANAHVGQARRLLMDEAYRRLTAQRRGRGIIATTDADTRVAPDWIAATRTEMSRGVDAVGGRILVDLDDLAGSGHTGTTYHLRDVGYRSLVTELEARLDPDVHDPWPRHFQHFGASFAVTAEIYRKAGGLPVQPWLEDVALYDALVRVDARIRHSPDVRVITSARRSGRAGFGFAVQITQWGEMERDRIPVRVESAAAVEACIKARRALRRAWQSQRQMAVVRSIQMERLADDLGVDSNWLGHTLATHSTFGALLQNVEHYRQECGVWRQQWPLVDIRDAIRDLRCRLTDLRQTPSLTLLKEVEAVEVSPLSVHVS